MAPPTFVQASTGTTDATGAFTFTGVAAGTIGDLVILHIVVDGTGAIAWGTLSAANITAIDGTANAWTQVGGTFNIGSATNAQHVVYMGRRASATLAPTFVTTANTSGDDVYGRMYEFTGVSAGATLASVIENVTAGATTNGAATNATVADASVTTLGYDRLAVNLVGINDDNPTVAFTGMTGGTWAEAVAEYADATGTDACLQLQTATLWDAGTIDGGTFTQADATDGWGTIGFALIPAFPQGTRIWLRGSTTVHDSSTHRGTNTADLRGSTTGWWPAALAATRGAGLVTFTTSTVAGTTAGVEATNTVPVEWLSEPLAADVTISGAIGGNIWAAESDALANVAINFVVDVVRATDNAIVNIATSARTTELAVVTSALNGFTVTPGSGVVVNRGDRLRVRVFGDDAGTMAASFTFTVGVSGATAGANGDTSITFTETLTFDTAAPAGTQVFLTNTNSVVSTASLDKEAWTSRGSVSVSQDVLTLAGFRAPIQWGDPTVIDWFTRPLQAVTLAGRATANIWMRELDAATNCSARMEIAVVNGDGTSPVVWCSWCLNPTTTGSAELNSVTQTAQGFVLSGDDLAVTQGQRIRLRLYADDLPNTGMVTGGTATVSFSGSSGGVNGDSFVTFPVTLTEFVSTRVPRSPGVDSGNAHF